MKQHLLIRKFRHILGIADNTERGAYASGDHRVVATPLTTTSQPTKKAVLGQLL